MALKMEFKQGQGFICPKEDSYLKITCLSGNKTCMRAEITFFHKVEEIVEIVEIVEEEEEVEVPSISKTILYIPCLSKTISYIPDLEDTNNNFIKQAYIAIKLDKDFLTAEDC